GCSTGQVNQTFTAATINRAAEVPPAAGLSDADGSATASGSAQVVVDGQVAKYTLTVNGLTGITASHIHSPGAAGVNASVVITLFDGPTTGAFSGRLDCVKSTQTAPITAPATATCGSAFSQSTISAGGSTRTFDQLVADMQAKNAYVNVHTTVNPAGAIRGQLQ
ncbi:MAG: CHRD domain-containing protein, partial [Gemmatimonadetes bacterium]|nr:CHRD domain-containing protein [Gemmatimonadota bacterium]